MLRLEPTTTYIVYPSWAKLSQRWENLWPLLSAPLKSGYFDPKTDWRRLGYPDVAQPFRLIDGPADGGIVSVEVPPTEKSMAFVVLGGEEANIQIPVGYTSDEVESGGHVYYLEPRDGPLAGVPFAPAELRQRARPYVCGVSVEHVESARDSLFWIVGFERGTKTIKGLGDVEGWAGQFGLRTTSLVDVPEPVRAETAPWFVDPAYEYAWFAVESEIQGVGFHYAVVVYLAYHLRWIGGRRMFCMHLVADIEGKPNARRLWNRK